MIFSEHWIREWVDPDLDTTGLVEKLTMAGLEVDSVAPVARAFSGIVVGEVVAVTPHPDADKLRVCRVVDGREEFQVVCGAPNARQGMKAPFARIGAEIHVEEGGKPLAIRQAKLRGVESRGMLCSAEELGLEESSAGLLELPESAPLGVDIRDYLGLDDKSIEVDLTPNRGDCLSVRGIAREIAALTGARLRSCADLQVPATRPDTFPVRITARSECPRYLGRIIRGIDPDAQTPFWITEKLRRCGLRSIDPVVDVTNFVLLELGQPMHAFDLDKLHGAIDVRLSKPQESITLLDGKTIEMSAGTLVIADQLGAVAMAGIMGGQRSAVSDTTTTVFLECAYFSPLAVAGRARSHGLHTDASHRYERGVDFELQARAMERATELLLEIAGGEPGPVTEATGELPAAPEVALTFASVPRLLGVQIPHSEIGSILSRLGFETVHADGAGMRVRVPAFRFDIEIEADLVEEIARVHGYQNIPAASGLAMQALKGRPEAAVQVGRIKQHLVSLGYQEVITYSFIEPGWSDRFLPAGQETIALQNPISSDMSVMRGSLLPGLVATLKYNENRQLDRVRLFETGLVFRREAGSTLQPSMVAGLVSGSRNPLNWANGREPYDFFDIKGDVELLLGLTRRGGEFAFRPGNHPAFHPGQCATVWGAGVQIGTLGALHPRLQRELGVAAPVYLFEIALDELQAGRIPSAAPLSRYPEVTRDLAILVRNETQAADIQAVMYENAGEFLTGLGIFDLYQGDAVEEGKKSLAMGLTWQHPSRTLTDDEINQIIARCINALEQKFAARLRN